MCLNFLIKVITKVKKNKPFSEKYFVGLGDGFLINPSIDNSGGYLTYKDRSELSAQGMKFSTFDRTNDNLLPGEFFGCSCKRR